MPICPKCGYYNKEGNEYCVNCGAEIQLTPAEMEAKTKVKKQTTYMWAVYFIGGFFLLSAFTTIWGTISWYNSVRGTILDDAFSRQLYSNQMSWGMFEMVIGFIVFAIGYFLSKK